MSKTQAHVDEGGVGVMECIGSRWSCGFGLENWMLEKYVGNELIFKG